MMLLGQFQQVIQSHNLCRSFILSMLKTVISGGQTGVDRTALDWAMTAGISHAGYCPAGRKAEDGKIDGKYQLTETNSKKYSERTSLNVQHSDATLIFAPERNLSRGTALTASCAQKFHRPLLIITDDLDDLSAAAEIQKFLLKNNVQQLNIAGPRRTQSPDMAERTERVLNLWWQIWKTRQYIISEQEMDGVVIAETSRLLIRPWREEDFRALVSMNSDAQVMKYIGTGETSTEEGTRAYYQSLRDNHSCLHFSRYALQYREEVIGFCGLGIFLGEIDFGWRLQRKYWERASQQKQPWLLPDIRWSNFTSPCFPVLLTQKMLLPSR